MRISQGIQNKILEAMAAGLPVVTTPAAAAGFASIGEMPIAVASSAEDFAGHVIKFLREPLRLSGLKPAAIIWSALQLGHQLVHVGRAS